jgi:hypothetical protein
MNKGCGSCLSWVIRVVLILRRLLPVYVDKLERTTPRVNVEFLGIELLYQADEW